MPRIDFTEDDLKQGMLVDPAWYRVHVDSVGEKPTVTEKGPSINFPCAGVILFDANTGNNAFKGVRIYFQFNSKFKSAIKAALEAIGENVTAGSYELKALEGKEIDVFVERGEYQGRFNNRVNGGFRAPRPDVTERE
jgi:hypothetical protein